MNLDRGTKAIVVSGFFVPLLLGFMFYTIALSQQHKLTWEGFISSNWAAPYFAIGAVAYVVITIVGVYWLHQDNKHQQLTCATTAELMPENRNITIDDTRWDKLQALGGINWLNAMIDKA